MVINNKLTISLRGKCCLEFFDVRSQSSVKMGIELADRLGNVVQHSRDCLACLLCETLTEKG